MDMLALLETFVPGVAVLAVGAAVFTVTNWPNDVRLATTLTAICIAVWASIGVGRLRGRQHPPQATASAPTRVTSISDSSVTNDHNVALIHQVEPGTAPPSGLMRFENAQPGAVLKIDGFTVDGYVGGPLISHDGTSDVDIRRLDARNLRDRPDEGVALKATPAATKSTKQPK